MSNFFGGSGSGGSGSFTANYVPYGNGTGLQENAAFQFFTAGGLQVLSTNSVLGVFEGSNTGAVQMLYRSSATAATTNFPAFTFEAKNSAAADTQMGRCAIIWNTFTSGSETAYWEFRELLNGSMITNMQLWGDSLRLLPYGTSAGNTTPLQLYELAANGTNYVGLKSPDSIASSFNLVAPTALPSATRPLYVDSSGNMTIDVAGTWVGRQSGQFYGWDIINSTNTGAVAANTLYAISFVVYQTEAPVDISIEVTTTGTSTGARLGIYAATSGGLPGSLVSDAGTVATGTNGTKTATFSPAPTLTPGLYYLVAVFDGTATVRTAVMNNRSNRLGQPALATNPTIAYTIAFAYGTLPGSYGSGTGNNTAAQPAITLRY